MSQSTRDPEKFREHWNSHLSDLYGLRNTLPQEEWAELEKQIEALSQLVDVAAEELEDDDE